jgi:hypothetical protein
LSFHLGSASAFHVLGASASLTSFLLYTMTIGVTLLGYTRPPAIPFL